jgi:hypothetical protein
LAELIENIQDAYELMVTSMPKKLPLMRLSRDEELFLRHWMYDEAHYQDGPGPAKRLQVQYRAIPADLAVLIAAAIPDPLDQEEAGLGPPPVEPATWPWSEAAWRERVSAARAALADRPPDSEPL